MHASFAPSTPLGPKVASIINTPATGPVPAGTTKLPVLLAVAYSVVPVAASLAICSDALVPTCTLPTMLTVPVAIDCLELNFKLYVLCGHSKTG
jgi:hypothetical protein